jgi:hypothetical protein
MSVTEWTTEITEAIRDRMIRAEDHKLSHIGICNSMTKRYKVLTVSGIVIGPLISIISGADGSATNPALLGVITGLGVLSGLVVSLIKFGKYDERATNHKIAADGYGFLESEIRNQLLLSENDRLKAKTYMEWSQIKFNELFTSSPLLNITSYKKHNNAAPRPRRQRTDHVVHIEDDFDGHRQISKQKPLSKLESNLKNTHRILSTHKSRTSVYKHTQTRNKRATITNNTMLQYEIDRMVSKRKLEE